MRIFIRLAQLTFCAFLLLGCTQDSKSKGSLQENVGIAQSQPLNLWHDGSTGGAYGIGTNWSLEILPAEYETFTEKVIIQGGLSGLPSPLHLNG